jgi:hypothetical protein
MKNSLFIILIFAACGSEHTRESSGDSTAHVYTDSVTLAGNDAVSENSLTVKGEGNFEFVNDEIGGDPFAKDLQSVLASMHVSSIDKKPVRNLHDSTVTDTLVIVHFGESMMEYYQTNQNAFIITASIKSPQIAFKKGIAIGMTEREFIQRFEELRQVENLNFVTISTFEGLGYSEFLFSGDTLSSMTYQSYFD